VSKVGDLTNMQNVLNHVSNRSSHLTGKCGNFFFNFQRLVRGSDYNKITSIVLTIFMMYVMCNCVFAVIVSFLGVILFVLILKKICDIIFDVYDSVTTVIVLII